jgi:menaquinone-dependent protoporphyrinogen oxidase
MNKMKSIIIYASKHGCAEKAANLLYDKLNGIKEIVNIRENSKINIKNFDTVIIGGSIYGGKIQKEIKEFIEKKLSILLEKKIGLFLCCGMEKDYKKQLENSFPKELLNHLTVDGYFGYEFNVDKMGFIEKSLVKLIAKDKVGDSKISKENIQKFADRIQGE